MENPAIVGHELLLRNATGTASTDPLFSLDAALVAQNGSDYESFGGARCAVVVDSSVSSRWLAESGRSDSNHVSNGADLFGQSQFSQLAHAGARHCVPRRSIGRALVVFSWNATKGSGSSGSNNDCCHDILRPSTALGTSKPSDRLGIFRSHRVAEHSRGPQSFQTAAAHECLLWPAVLGKFLRRLWYGEQTPRRVYHFLCRYNRRTVERISVPSQAGWRQPNAAMGVAVSSSIGLANMDCCLVQIHRSKSVDVPVSDQAPPGRQICPGPHGRRSVERGRAASQIYSRRNVSLQISQANKGRTW